MEFCDSCNFQDECKLKSECIKFNFMSLDIHWGNDFLNKSIGIVSGLLLNFTAFVFTHQY